MWQASFLIDLLPSPLHSSWHKGKKYALATLRLLCMQTEIHYKEITVGIRQLTANGWLNLYGGSEWIIFLITPGSVVLGSQELVLHAVLLSTLSQIHSNISIYKTLLLLKQHTSAANTTPAPLLNCVTPPGIQIPADRRYLR